MNDKKRKMRMTLPKKQEDIQNIVEEISATHTHTDHHHHHHAGEANEIMKVIDIFISAMDTRMTELEEKIDILRKEMIKLYQLFSILVKSMSAKNEDDKISLLKKAVELVG